MELHKHSQGTGLIDLGAKQVFDLVQKSSASGTEDQKTGSSSQVADNTLEDNDENFFEAYIGAELYSQRMFPYGCPSF